MKRTLYQVLLALLLLTGCNDPKPVTDALTRAEALMNEDPDSAWAVLNALSPDEMGQSRTRAHYALLYTQAQDKTYRDETNDSLISIAVDYYRHTDDARHKFLSYYYKGRVHFNAKDYLTATSCYMEAEQLADAVGDDYLTGLLYAELGRIYDIYYDYSKSLEAHQKAAECYERAGKTRHRNYMWFNQSSIYRNINKYDEAERLLRMTLDSAKEEKNNALLKSCLGNLMMLCIEEERMSEAKSFYEELKLLVDEDYGSSSFLGKLAQLYASEGDLAQAKKSLEQGWSRAADKVDSVSLYISSANLHCMQGENAFAYQELLKGIVMQNGETRQALQQPVLTAQRDYLSEKLEFEAYKLRMRKLLNLVSALFFLLLLGVLVYVFVRIFRRYKKESQQVISHLKSEKHKIEEENNRITLALQQLDKDKKNADQTIAMLRVEIDNEKEENRQKMKTLILQLEEDSRVNTESIMRLRSELENREEEYRLYVQNAETEVKALLNDNRRMMFQKVELLKHVLELVVAVVLLHERKYIKEKTKEKKIEEGIQSLKTDYYAGDAEYRKVEALVNRYLDNVMAHFRKEVHLASESEYRRVCYMFAGVSGQVIGEIMDESKDAVYQRRSRLLKKIGSLSCAHKEMFVLLMSK